MPFGFEDLKIYQRALDLVARVYCILVKFPAHEMYVLSSQLRRAVISIALNIAEGTGRSKKDFSHFLDIARTSAYECVACLTIAMRRGYIVQAQYEDLYKEFSELTRMINSLKQKLQ